MPVRHFVKYTFLKVDPAWRRLGAAVREQHKREFAAACDHFGADRFLRAFSLVGTRGDADLLLWTSSPGLLNLPRGTVHLAPEPCTLEPCTPNLEPCTPNRTQNPEPRT